MWQMMDFLEDIADTNDVRRHCTQWKQWVQDNIDMSTVPDAMWKMQEKTSQNRKSPNNSKNRGFKNK